MDELIALDGQWELALVANSELKPGTDDFDEAARADGAIVVPATVPGNFELDLFAAGVESDPYFGDNIRRFYKYENRHLFYRRSFTLAADKRYFLCFDGIDAIADVFLNGHKVLSVDNAFVGHEVDVEKHLGRSNTLVVHIFPAFVEARKREYTMRSWQNCYFDAEARHIRKPPHAYGWDIMPRALSGGIYKPCYLRKKKPAYIKNVCYFADGFDFEKGKAVLSFVYNLHVDEDSLAPYRLVIDGNCGDSAFRVEEDLWHTSGLIFRTPVEKCKFWYPKNYGEPNLYGVSVRLYRGGDVVDEYSFRLGIRKVELIRSSVVEDGGTFRFRVNGENVFVLGTNWTPLDCYHSKDKSRLPRALGLLGGLGCNMVRCWGGNLYEDDEFYDYCDENGIMVWQDFAMGCGLYPNDEEFLRSIRKEAEFVVKRLRNHPSLCLWAGDNECDLFATWCGLDPNANKITREVLPEVVNEYDFKTPYLPSSPYVDENAYSSGKATSETHTWSNRPYFKSALYADDEAYFQSEIGYQGSMSPSSMRKCISEEKIGLWRLAGKGEPDAEWSAHAPNVVDGKSPFSFIYPLTDKHIRTLFSFEPDDLADYARASQISQAEAFKYFIERMRIRRGEKTGIVWWNFIDGFPVHSNAVVDYYFTEKLAYKYIKRSSCAVCFMFDEPVDGYVSLCGVNDSSKDATVTYSVTDAAGGEELLSGTAVIKAGGAVRPGKVYVGKEKKFLSIRYSHGGKEYFNHFMSNMPDINYGDYLSAMKKCGIYEFDGFDE